MIIGVDKNQKKGKHDLKHQQLLNKNHELVSLPIPVGDYIEITPKIQSIIKRRGDKLKKMDLIGLIDVSVDTKKDCSELYSCLVQDHSRFSDSLLLAQNNGIKLIILIENEEGIEDIDGILKWRNPQYFRWLKKQKQGVKKKPPVRNEILLKMMHSMESKYGCQFQFCSPLESANKIVELLTKVEDNEPTPFPERE